jgi:DNA/RNA-binding domain of Phe-tRNA-synthetase-like protein
MSPPSDPARREKIDMAVFGVAPGFRRCSLRWRGSELAAAAPAAAAYLASVGRRSVPQAQLDALARSWEEVYLALGVPPDVPPPPLALAHWAATPGGVPSAGPLPDLVNAFALQVLAPAAAYDLGHVAGDLWLRPSRGCEIYEPLEGGQPSTPPIGELILADSADRVLARHWHGAPGRRSFAGPDSRDVLVHLDLLGPQAAQASELAARLERLLVGVLGGRIDVRLLGRQTPVVTWGS